MSDIKIGKIQKIGLRELWKREDVDFTKWLEENIDHLTDALDFHIDIESREKAAGPFSVDLYGEDAYGNKVIIENQLEKTDHTHLGQILTYLVNLEAKTAIWITSKPVEEHKRVIDWLNEITPDDISFYLVQLEAIKTGDDSLPAPLFTVIESPNSDIKKIGTEKRQDAKRHASRHALIMEFWAQFIVKINERDTMCQNINPGNTNWFPVALGTSGVSMNLVVTNTHVRCEIYIDISDREKNKIIFDHLFSQKEKIERDAKTKLDWRKLEDKQASKIEIKLLGVNLSKKEDWPQMNDFLIENAINMHKAFKEHIPAIRDLFT